MVACSEWNTATYVNRQLAEGLACCGAQHLLAGAEAAQAEPACLPLQLRRGLPPGFLYEYGLQVDAAGPQGEAGAPAGTPSLNAFGPHTPAPQPFQPLEQRQSLSPASWAATGPVDAARNGLRPFTAVEASGTGAPSSSVPYKSSLGMHCAVAVYSPPRRSHADAHADWSPNLKPETPNLHANVQGESRACGGRPAYAGGFCGSGAGAAAISCGGDGLVADDLMHDCLLPAACADPLNPLNLQPYCTPR